MHPQHMDPVPLPKLAIKYKPVGKRDVGRPRKRSNFEAGTGLEVSL